MYVEDWASLADSPLPYRRLTWKTEADSSPLADETIGALVIEDSLGRRHRYDAVSRSWYDTLAADCKKQRLVAATAARHSNRFPFMGTQPVVPQVTGARFAELLHAAPRPRAQDNGELIIGAVRAAFDTHGISLDEDTSDARIITNTEAIEAAQYAVEDYLDKSMMETIANTDDRGSVTELPVATNPW